MREVSNFSLIGSNLADSIEETDTELSNLAENQGGKRTEEFDLFDYATDDVREYCSI